MELPTLEDSIAYIRGHFNELYPKTESRRKTVGNLPERLHAEISEMAEGRNLRMFEVVAGLLDFYREYEAEFETDLDKQRAASKTRR